MLYRKKPVVVEANQLTDDTWNDILWWIESQNGKVKEWCWDDNDKYLIIKTLEGDHKASLNDFIIKGVKGEFYPCKPDIFELTYEFA